MNLAQSIRENYIFSTNNKTLKDSMHQLVSLFWEKVDEITHEKLTLKGKLKEDKQLYLRVKEKNILLQKKLEKLHEYLRVAIDNTASKETINLY